MNENESNDIRGNLLTLMLEPTSHLRLEKRAELKLTTTTTTTTTNTANYY